MSIWQAEGYYPHEANHLVKYCENSLSWKRKLIFSGTFFHWVEHNLESLSNAKWNVLKSERQCVYVLQTKTFDKWSAELKKKKMVRFFLRMHKIISVKTKYTEIPSRDTQWTKWWWKQLELMVNVTLSKLTDTSAILFFFCCECQPQNLFAYVWHAL